MTAEPRLEAPAVRASLPTRQQRLEAMLDQLGDHAARHVPRLTECLYIAPSTICNLKCRFCAYPRSTLDKRLMPHELFTRVIEKACAFGFATFGLTPVLGEALLDPYFLCKLMFLEVTPGVSSYSFTTNFTVASPAVVAQLAQLKKLRSLQISIYGHNEDSFTRITQAPPRFFHKLLQHLEMLADSWESAARVELRLRTTGAFTLAECDPRLRRVLDALQARKAQVRVPHDRYSNWGGLISPADVAGLGIRLKPVVAPQGPCTLLFYKPTVLPDGRLNACYSEDGNAALVIGDLSRQSFEEIYSLTNETYLRLITDQCLGRFASPCQECSGHRPTEQWHYSYNFHTEPFQTLAEFLESLH
ncbi:MAG: SPASM domain-containing protein [Gemmataceae bacterium]